MSLGPSAWVAFGTAFDVGAPVPGGWAWAWAWVLRVSRRRVGGRGRGRGCCESADAKSEHDDQADEARQHASSRDSTANIEGEKR